MKNKMMKILTLSLAVGLSTTLMAKPNIDNSGAKERTKQMAGEKGMFVKNEVFPKDYFLIPKTLPFAVFLTLHHPRSSELGLTQKQIEDILKIKGDTGSIVIKAAKEIKALEIALAKRIIKGETAKENHKAVDEIALKKAALTKAHLGCIETVIGILTPKQIEILLSYVRK